jgi:hypothetical protein
MRKDSQVDAGSPQTGRDSDSASLSKRSQHSADDASSFSTSMYNDNSPEELDDPFDDELDDELLDDYPPVSPLSRRRTMPEKAAQLTGIAMEDTEQTWRGASKLSALQSLRNRNPDSPDAHQVPLKAQKMLGISRRGRMMSESEYRTEHALSPQTENVAPKAQKMLGIPSNPFQKSYDERRQMYGDELDQAGIMGPTANSESPRRNMDEYRRALLASEREYMNPSLFAPKYRENGSNTDVSSLSRSSLVSSPVDSASVETPRSSHEATPRPRLNTDPYPIPNMTDPYAPPSPGSFDDASPASLKNKPLPPRPDANDPTFELAGSAVPPNSTPTPTPQMPNPQKRRLLQQTRHAAAKAMQARAHTEPRFAGETSPSDPVELPAEPFTGGPVTGSPSSGPGSALEPVELPAREATPIDYPPRNSFRSSIASTASTATHIAPQNKSPPAVPPPRRGGSNRSTIIMPQGIPELAEKTPTGPSQPDPSKTRNSFATDQMTETRSATRPPPPPHRTMSAQRIDRFTNAARPRAASNEKGQSPPKASGSFRMPLTVTNLPPPSGPPPLSKLPPTPPPRRRASSETGANPPRGSIDNDSDNAASPTTPRMPSGPKPAAVPARLPKLQTQIGDTGISFTDQLVSALSPSSYRNPLSPGDTISMVSVDSPAFGAGGKKPSLGSIAMAVAKHSQAVAPDRRPSKQELARLDEVVNDDKKTDKEKIDVLADLGVLQREVDALRRAFASNSISTRSGSKDNSSDSENDGQRCESSSERGGNGGGEDKIPANNPSPFHADNPRKPSQASESSISPRTKPAAQFAPMAHPYHPTAESNANPSLNHSHSAPEQPDPFEPPHPGTAWDPARASQEEVERRESHAASVSSHYSNKI